MYFIAATGLLLILAVAVSCLAFYQSAIAAGRRASKAGYVVVAAVLSAVIGLVFYKGPLHEPLLKREGVLLIETHYRELGCRDVNVVSSGRQAHSATGKIMYDYFVYNVQACGAGQHFLYDALADKLYLTD